MWTDRPIGEPTLPKSKLPVCYLSGWVYSENARDYFRHPYKKPPSFRSGFTINTKNIPNLPHLGAWILSEQPFWLLVSLPKLLMFIRWLLHQLKNASARQVLASGGGLLQVVTDLVCHYMHLQCRSGNGIQATLLSLLWFSGGIAQLIKFSGANKETLQL